MEAILDPFRLPELSLTIFDKLQEGIDAISLAAIVFQSIAFLDICQLDKIERDDLKGLRIMSEFAKPD